MEAVGGCKHALTTSSSSLVVLFCTKQDKAAESTHKAVAVLHNLHCPDTRDRQAWGLVDSDTTSALLGSNQACFSFSALLLQTIVYVPVA